MAEPKKMEPGRTKIGTITAKDENDMVKEYTICFGNIAFPQKNGKFMHLRNERYREILSKFLDSDEGLDYIAPTEEEIEKARIAVLNREAMLKKKQEEKAQEEEIKKAREQLDAIEQMPADAYQEPEDPNEEVFADDTAGQPKAGNNVPVLILLALNILLNGFLLYRSLAREYIAGSDRISLSIGEETFTVPTTSIPRTGETTISFYGISTTNNNGQITRQAIPVGEIKIGG